MSYSEWFYSHGEKHKAIMDKLTRLSVDEVITYFRFDNMVKNEPDFCPLYKENKKCHDIPELNCYLCACPNFKFRDKGFSMRGDKMLFSVCNINSKEGGEFIGDDAIHQDCSKCHIPHHESYIRKIFDRDWFEIMESVC
ncbi:MAG: hypothetical protein DRG09_00505 [Epsilonproteobacteria bacterium]|nr:MAG: hypothetical protein DRG09_00505 [Campylobacterota bacterium]